MPSRDAVRLLAAAGVASAEDVAKIPILGDADAAEMIVGWFIEFAEKLQPFRELQPMTTSDGLDGIIAGAQAHRMVGEPLHERHVARALRAALANLSKTPPLGTERALAAGQMLVTPRVLNLSSGRAASGAATTTAEPQPVQLQQPGGIPPAHAYATAFFGAAQSEEEFDLFIRNSSMFTLDGIVRLALLTDVRGSRLALAAALEAKLVQTACDVGSVIAMLGAGRTSTQLLDTFRALVESGRAVAGAAPAAAPAAAPVVVRIGDTELPDGDDRPEAVALSRDVSEMAKSQTMCARLRTLGDAVNDVNMLFNATVGPETGAPLRRVLETPQETMLSKALVRHQMPDDLVQIIQLVRAALARRVLLGVFGSAAAEQTPQVKQCVSALRQGLLGRARPGLLIPSAGASSAEDPLSFLDNMTDGAGSLAMAFMYMQNALCIAFPSQAADTLRWFVAAQRFVTDERGDGASWKLLSAWWAGVCKACDRRVERVVQREIVSLRALDVEILTASAARYVVIYRQARSVEMAKSARDEVEDAGGGLQAKVDRAVAAALKKKRNDNGGGKGGDAANGKEKKRAKRGGRGRGDGNGGGGGDGGGGGGGGGRVYAFARAARPKAAQAGRGGCEECAAALGRVGAGARTALASRRGVGHFLTAAVLRDAAAQQSPARDRPARRLLATGAAV